MGSLGNMGGISLSSLLGGGVGGMGYPPYSRGGYDPLRRYGGHGGLGMGMGMGVGVGVSTGLGAMGDLAGSVGALGGIQGDMLGGRHFGLLLDAMLLGGRNAALAGLRSPLDDQFLARLNALGYGDVLRYSGGLSCGCDKNCEHQRSAIDCASCSSSGRSGSSTKELKTKDIVVRGKTYKIRKSFLVDASKFESDIVKLLDKKSEETMPNHVVQMLVDFINTEHCRTTTLLDLVSMNVLASSLSVKSAVEHSLNLLKKYEIDYNIGGPELTQMCVTVLASGKVDDKLTEWLKKFLEYDGRWERLLRNEFYQTTLYRKPQLQIQIAQLIGLIEKDDGEDGFRIL